MAIPFVTIELDKPRRLRFGMGAQVEFEQISGKTIAELGKDLSAGSLSSKTLADLLFVMIRHDDKDLTRDALYDLIDEHASSMQYIQTKTIEAVGAAFKEGKGAKVPNAQKPKG